jgi:hypothetical protein
MGFHPVLYCRAGGNPGKSGELGGAPCGLAGADKPSKAFRRRRRAVPMMPVEGSVPECGGIPSAAARQAFPWIPACAGMTRGG